MWSTCSAALDVVVAFLCAIQNACVPILYHTTPLRHNLVLSHEEYRDPPLGPVVSSRRCESLPHISCSWGQSYAGRYPTELGLGTSRLTWKRPHPLRGLLSALTVIDRQSSLYRVQRYR